jgi:DHA1 family bicyclomycin/chloramphenicol resistance-like MFS transporter
LTRATADIRDKVSRLSPVTLAVLGALSAFGPLSTDMYLPGLPSMGHDLHAPSSTVQLTLSLSLLGLAVGQLFAGPLSDALGRRRPLLAGLVAYVVASVVCAVAPGIALLLAARLVQGLAGAAGIAIARAVVRDRAEGVAAARAFAALMVVSGLGPIVAPIAGGLLLRVTDWRGIFGVLAGIGALLIVGSLLAVPESLPPARRDTSGLAGVRDAAAVLVRDAGYVGHTLAGALSFGVLMAYIAASPFVLERIYGLSPSVYSLVFAANGTGILIGRQVGAWRLRQDAPARVLRAALAVQAAAALAFLVVISLHGGLAPVLVCLFVSAACMGAIMPMATALAMEDHPERAGSASGLLGFTQFTLGSLVAPLVGLGGARSALPMALAMAVCGLAANAALRLARAPASA